MGIIKPYFSARLLVSAARRSKILLKKKERKKRNAKERGESKPQQRQRQESRLQSELPDANANEERGKLEKKISDFLCSFSFIRSLFQFQSKISDSIGSKARKWYSRTFVVKVQVFIYDSNEKPNPFRKRPSLFPSIFASIIVFVTSALEVPITGGTVASRIALEDRPQGR